MSATFCTRLRFRLTLWWSARILPIQIGDRTLSDVLQLARHDNLAPFHGLPLAYILKRVRRTVRRPLLMRDRKCLREGLLAFQFLSAAGYKPELHFGVDQTSLSGPSVKAHCWVVHNQKAMLNPPNENMVPILIHRATDANTAMPARFAGASFD